MSATGQAGTKEKMTALPCAAGGCKEQIERMREVVDGILQRVGGNLRFGVKSDSWEAAAFVNNLWDERAFLSLDRERGTRARVGFLTNMPRTYGVSLRMNF